MYFSRFHSICQVSLTLCESKVYITSWILYIYQPFTEIIRTSRLKTTRSIILNLLLGEKTESFSYFIHIVNVFSFLMLLDVVHFHVVLTETLFLGCDTFNNLSYLASRYYTQTDKRSELEGNNLKVKIQNIVKERTQFQSFLLSVFLRLYFTLVVLHSHCVVAKTRRNGLCLTLMFSLCKV